MYTLTEKEQEHIGPFVERLRKEYKQVISSYIVNVMYPKQQGIGEDWSAFFRACTVMQLQALADACTNNNGNNTLVLSTGNPKNYAHYMLGNMFVGVETDGYTHS